MNELASKSVSERTDVGPGDPCDDPGDPDAVARILCLRQLDARARTRVELERYLARKGVPADSAGRVLDRFTEVGLIDDRALARSFVTSRHEEQGLARRALALKLRQRGVDSEVIDEAVEEVDGADEIAAARRLVQRRLASLKGLDVAVQSRRLVGMLGRKGYGPGLAFQVVREVLAESSGVSYNTDCLNLVALDLD